MSSLARRLGREAMEKSKSKKERPTFLLGGFVILAALAVSSYFWWSEIQSEKYVAPLEKITIGVEKSILPAVVWLAENKGYFEEERLDLTIKEFDSGKASLRAMLDGEGIDISAAAPTPIMFASFSREDFFIFGTFAYAYEDIKVIANKDSGIIKVEDLKGKKIGTLMGSTGQFFAETFLIYNSISPSEVEMVNITPSDLPEALKSGHIDAQVIWEPHGTIARNLLGDKAVRLPSGNVYKTTFNFLTIKNFAHENSEALVRFLRAINKATDYLNNNKEESQAIIANRLNLTKENVALHWDDFKFHLSLDQSFITNIESEARWAITNEFTDKTEVPNYLKFIYLDALQSVKPEVITIIR